MKKISALTIILVVIFISCKKVITLSPPQIEPNPPKEAELVEPAGDQCYTSRLNGNIVALSFNVNSNQEVNGKLSYNITGKDKNEGTIIGNMKGDTLTADYTFMSEGISSVREVVFLQKEGTFIEGYGDVTDTNDKVTFKDKKKLKFDAKNTLIQSDCPE
jgi:hypothetical protein